MPPIRPTPVDPTDLLTAIARSAERLSQRDSWPEGVNTLLAELGQSTGISRVWIFQTVELGPTHIVQDYVFEWAASPEYAQMGMSCFSMFTKDFELPEYRALIESRRRGEHQSMMPDELPPSWLRTHLVDEQHIQSMLTIPIMVDGLWWGTLGFDDCQREYRWSKPEIALLRTASALITNAILRDQLSARDKQFEILKALTDSSAWQIDLKTARGWVTGKLAKIPGQPPAERNLNILSLCRLIHPEDVRRLVKAARQYVADGEGTFRHDVRLRHHGPRQHWVEIIGSVSSDMKGRPEQLAGIAVDIQHRKRQEIILRRMAETDPLTGAVNRRAFDDHLDFHLSKAQRKDRPLSLLMLDLDRFKAINDAWGHPTGDMVLKKFADICRTNLRDGDVLARMGGEEFALLLPGANAQAACAAGERIRCMLEATQLDSCRGLQATVSIGCATCLCGSSTGHELVADADMALYKAKRAGRNRLIAASSHVEH
ncbi:sensor domain-containing diguanylate cyclase [Desulfovibrio ferrophilus]|uniref:diguanylate cyclase n=1 Tax=Desulfovibrio ferrophilus TaxID=241368 RepID=A0A2Z6B2Y9_9BACT|nr:diguanylate cyclase [Desulfovibrio ferrophilus]BBD09894.1 diguanylate cyclase with PAS/PAC and GAF sensors [Desulfovibrio ferrophilus]